MDKILKLQEQRAQAARREPAEERVPRVVRSRFHRPASRVINLYESRASGALGFVSGVER